MINTIALIVFALGYLGIILEHKTRISKSALALFMGGILWVFVVLAGHEHVHEEIFHASGEIFEIVIFLLAAMSLVEILIHYKFFDYLRAKILRLGLGEKHQFLLITSITFLLSAIIDNLTATIVFIQISRRFFKKENIPVVAAAIVVAANAGGAFSPLGDVTTIMLWLADKFTAGQIITRGILPSLTIFSVATLFFYPQIKESTYDDKKDTIVGLTKSEKIVIGIAFASYILPLIMHFFGLPPYFGLLIGLGAVWIVVDLFKVLISKHQTHLSVSIDELLQKTDISSLKFFIGILLAVSALSSLGVLESMSHVVYGESPSFTRFVVGTTGLGIVSAVLDNVPLTAIAIQVLHSDITSLWILFAIAVGTGGSLLIIGSAAGVICMGMVKELNFMKYIKIAALPALVSYFAGIGVWYLQYLVLGGV